LKTIQLYVGRLTFETDNSVDVSKTQNHATKSNHTGMCCRKNTQALSRTEGCCACDVDTCCHHAMQA
jgi:hypothetical protein